MLQPKNDNTNMYPDLSIQLVTWNSMKFLPGFFDSLKKQTYQNFRLVVVDNGSDDGLSDFLRREYPNVVLIRNAHNLGFSVAHNQGIRYAFESWGNTDLSNKFILVTNPDIVLSPTYLQNILEAALLSQKAGSFCGKILRAYEQANEDEYLRETVCSDMIDTTGLYPKKNRNFYERGAGEIDKVQ